MLMVGGVHVSLKGWSSTVDVSHMRPSLVWEGRSHDILCVRASSFW